jgi:hypothetical protein
VHVVPAPKATFPQWLNELSFAIGTGLASTLIYDMLKLLYDHASFSDATAEKVIGMMKRLEILEEEGVPEVARFVQATRHPGFSKDMAI